MVAFFFPLLKFLRMNSLKNGSFSNIIPSVILCHPCPCPSEKYAIFPDDEIYNVYDSDIEIEDFYNHLPVLPDWIADFKKQRFQNSYQAGLKKLIYSLL